MNGSHAALEQEAAHEIEAVVVVQREPLLWVLGSMRLLMYQNWMDEMMQLQDCTNGGAEWCDQVNRIPTAAQQRAVAVVNTAIGGS